MTDTTDANTHSAPPLSEAAALSDILDWSSKRPIWQRDALRRLVVNGELNENDIEALHVLCLDEDAPFDPLSPGHIAPVAEIGVSVALKGIHEPEGINALANDQSLGFEKSGLTLVYGDNGSGKSGYCRILKHACRSRDTRFEILPDINEDQDWSQEARIEFWRGDEGDETVWSPKSDGHSDLPSVSVFDSKSASTHVQKTNDVAYIPYPMRLLEQLAAACDAIKQRIDAEVAALGQETPRAISSPQLSDQTAAGSFLHNLGAKSKAAELELLTKLTEADEARFAALQTDLAQEPKKAIARLSSQRTSIIDQVESLRTLVQATSKEQFDELAHRKKTKDDSVTLAKAASQELFASAPLPEIGGDLWKSLWTAARAYAEGKAYADKSFPQDFREEDLCVLCQQPLGSGALKRLSTFEGFIKDTTAANAERARRAYEQAMRELAAANMSIRTFRRFIRTALQEMDKPALAASLRRTGVIGLWRLRAMLRDAIPNAPATSLVEQPLKDALGDFAKRIENLSAEDGSETRRALVAEHQELKDRITLQGLKADIAAELKRIERRTLLSAASKRVAKNAITTKNKELSEKLVTAALRDRFAREVAKLEIGAMPIELVKQRDRNAQSYFRVQIVRHPDVAVGEVLSEGEHRCVALAAFLAELVTSTGKSGIVFDDPMSSLDHLYRERVARRLVEEALHRQVIVFTHDLTFLFELDQRANELGCAIHYRTIRRKKQGPGYVENDLPLKAKASGSMVSAIETHLKSIKGQFDNWPEHQRTTTAKGVIGNIREAWEQAIADFCRPVLARFDSHVKPGSLHKLLVLTADDVRVVRKARSRLSTDLHASPETLNPAEVGHDDLVAETRQLKEWIADWKQRQRAAEQF